MTDFMFFCFY